MVENVKADNSAGKILSVPLAVIFIWFGAIKYTAGGAGGIEGLVNNSPLLSWVYSVFEVTSFGAILGTLEIIIGLLLLAGLSNLKIRAVAGIASIATYLVTLSFMLTTPGIVAEDSFFLVLSAMPGEFLLKDIVLLAASYVIFNSSRHALTGNSN